MTPTPEDFLHRLLNGELAPDEISRLEADPRWAADLRLLREVETWDTPPGLAHRQAWERLSRRLDPPSRIRRLTPLVWLGAAAAVLLLLLLVLDPFGHDHKPRQWTAQAGEQIDITLSDGSLVVLDAGSQLQTIGSWKKQRELALQGSAMFEVTKGLPFVVETERGTVRVLGTRFDVNAHKSHFVVRCFEGVVVAEAGSVLDTLREGEGARLTVDGWARIGWPSHLHDRAEGITSFQAAPLAEVFAAVERQFGVRIQLLEDDRLYTGAFPHDDLHQALDLILIPMDLEVESRDHQTIYLRKLLE